jgi:hypothetical protein
MPRHPKELRNSKGDRNALMKEFQDMRELAHPAYGRRSTRRSTTRTIQDVACAAIRRGFDDAQSVAAVLLAFPAADTTENCIRWYRNLIARHQAAFAGVL